LTYPQPYGYPVPPVQTQVLVHPYRCSTAHVVIAWVLAAVTGFYLLPWAISATRSRTNVGTTALVNLFLGWTLIGWVVALVMACGSERPVVVVQHLYAAPPQHLYAAPPQHPYAAPPQPLYTAPSSPPAVQPALPAAPAEHDRRAEPTMVDPFASEPTRPLPRSPWEPDHRR
jgi:Superinfection immunity protein